MANAIQNSETMARGIGGLTRAREELPQRIVAGLDRASQATRQSAASVKRHYDFLTAAYDFQAKYEEMLRKAPVLTERGKQFVARIELAERSERLKLTSATLRDGAKRGLVRGLAHIIAGLQRVQSMLETQRGETIGVGVVQREAVVVPAEPGGSADVAVLPEPAPLREQMTSRAPTSPPAPKRVRAAPGPAAMLSGIKTARYDSVVAWYKPAVEAVAAKAVPQEPKLAPALFPPEMEFAPPPATPVDRSRGTPSGMVAPAARRQGAGWRSVIARGRADPICGTQSSAPKSHAGRSRAEPSCIGETRRAGSPAAAGRQRQPCQQADGFRRGLPAGQRHRQCRGGRAGAGRCR